MKTFYEPDDKGRMRITESKGSKKPIKLAGGFVKKVEDMQNINDADYDKAIKIIKETSQGRRDRLRRMKNFHRDVFPPFNPV